MLRWKTVGASGRNHSFRSRRTRSTSSSHDAAIASIWRKASLAAMLAVLGGFAMVSLAVSVSHAQGSSSGVAAVADSERRAYADALAYCREDVPHPEALRADGRVLCLDGWIFLSDDISLANRLEHGGIFVVRNSGGNADGAIALASLLRIKEATVVINDYCVATCANYLFTSTAKAFVPKDALVAWTVGDRNGYCVGFSEMSDPRAPRLVAAPCP